MAATSLAIRAWPPYFRDLDIPAPTVAQAHFSALAAHPALWDEALGVLAAAYPDRVAPQDALDFQVRANKWDTLCPLARTQPFADALRVLQGRFTQFVDLDRASFSLVRDGSAHDFGALSLAAFLDHLEFPDDGVLGTVTLPADALLTAQRGFQAALVEMFLALVPPACAPPALPVPHAGRVPVPHPPSVPILTAPLPLLPPRAVAPAAATGRPDPGFGTNGVVVLKTDFDQDLGDLATGEVGVHSAPAVSGNTIIIGAAFREGFTPKTHNNTKGYVRAFDVRTGKRMWTFHTVPKQGQFGHDTWLNNSADSNANTCCVQQVTVNEEQGPT